MFASARTSARAFPVAAVALTVWASACRAGGEPAYSPVDGFLAFSGVKT
jgi:hypothetical protein